MTKDVQEAHVCFVDIVGYSKRTIEKQTTDLQVLLGIVREVLSAIESNLTESPFRIPTGDGLAVCFWGDPEPALVFALELNRRVEEHNQRSKSPYLLEIRTGLHSGNVMRVEDINRNDSVAGAGINVAQRVMDLAGPGQIFASVAFLKILREVICTNRFSLMLVYINLNTEIH